MSTRRSGRRRSRGSFGGGRRGKSLIIYGAIFFVIGLVITIATYAAADSGGGTYIISWGPMVGGLVAMIRGIIHVVADRRAMGQPTPLMPGAGYGASVPGLGQPGYGAPGFAAPGYMPPGYAAPGYAGPGYAVPGSTGPGQGFGAPAAGAPGSGFPSTSPGTPGFTPAPGFTPQPGPGTPGPGWFADPQDPTTLRWWDGQAWTAHTQPTAYTQPAGPGYPAGPAN
jgi:hypothetical protein